MSCKYALVVEDDVIPARDWYEKLADAINHIETNYNLERFMSLKLFTSFRSYDWILHHATATHWALASFLVGVCEFALLKSLF